MPSEPHSGRMPERTASELSPWRNNLEEALLGGTCDAQITLPPFSTSASLLCRVYDYYVAVHAVVAFGFASSMLLWPEVFGLFTAQGVSEKTIGLPAEDGGDPLMLDSIRWASPFVYGFSFFALSSLYMDSARCRALVAQVYVVAFALATAVGTVIQLGKIGANGREGSSVRWQPLEWMNVLLFAGLGVCYAFFLVVWKFSEKGQPFCRR